MTAPVFGGPSGGFPVPDASTLPWPFPGGRTNPAPADPRPAEPKRPDAQADPNTGNPWPAEWDAFEQEVLARTNATRAQGAVCGGQPMDPAPPVVLQAQLRSAARAHSTDMARRNYFEHASPEGAGPADRAVAAGFASRFVGENIAAGQPDPERVVRAWIDSPGHCVNMMDPRYRTLGVGYVLDDASDRYRHYWTQDFGG